MNKIQNVPSGNSRWAAWNAMVAHNSRVDSNSPPLVSSMPEAVFPDGPLTGEQVDNWNHQMIRLSHALHPGEEFDDRVWNAIGFVQNEPRDRFRGERSDLDPAVKKRGRDSNHVARTPLFREIRNALTAPVSVLTATIMAHGAVALNGKAPMAFFLLAVLVSAGNGVTAGLLATVLSLTAILSMFAHTISISNATHNIVALFLVIGIVSNAVFYNINRRNARLAQAKAEIEAAHLRLQDHSRSLAEANSRLAEQKIALFQAHEQLRLLSKQVAMNMHFPLKRISETTQTWVESNATSFDATLSKLSSQRIRDEIRRMDRLVADLEQYAQN